MAEAALARSVGASRPAEQERDLGRPDTHTLFAETGLRCTRQRVEVFEALAASCGHPTAEELHRIVNDRPPSKDAECCEDEGESGDSGEGRVSLATVYNTLDALCRVGLARRLMCACGGARYDADLHEHVHVTTEDGRVLDVPQDLGGTILRRIPEGVVREVEERLGVRIRRIRVEFEGESAEEAVSAREGGEVGRETGR